MIVVFENYAINICNVTEFFLMGNAIRFHFTSEDLSNFTFEDEEIARKAFKEICYCFDQKLSCFILDGEYLDSIK